MITTHNRISRTIICLMVFALVIGLFSPLLAEPALAASSRTASVVEVKGTAYLTKAGGSKPYRLFNRMTVNQGDTITTEADSSVVLNIIDRDDEITIGQNSEVYIADLLDADGASTGVKLWSGSVYAKVSELSESDSFKIDTPNATMGVRGTHFLVLIDPVTGIPTTVVFSGTVRTEPLAPPSGSSGPSKPVMPPIPPALQGTVIDDIDEENNFNSDGFVTYPDLDSILENADPDVLRKLLLNKQLIDEENEQFFNEYEETEDDVLDLSDEEAMERYRQNVNNMLHNILKKALITGSLSEDEIQEIIVSANKVITDEDRKYDLNREVPEIDRTAGVDPAAEEERRRQREEAERKKQQQVQQKEQQRQEVADKNQNLINQIQQRSQQQQQQNQQKQEEKQEEAIERYANQLTEQQRKALEERIRQREEEARSQQRVPAPAPAPAPTRPGNSNSNDDDDNGGPEDPVEPDFEPSVSLVSSGWDGEVLYIDVLLKDFPDAIFGTQLHILYNAEHLEAGEISSYASDVFAGSVESYTQETGYYTWANGDEPTLTTEIVFLALSTEEVTNDPIDGTEGEVLLRIPLAFIGQPDQVALGSIILKEVLVVDREGSPLPYEISTHDVQYEWPAAPLSE